MITFFTNQLLKYYAQYIHLPSLMKIDLIASEEFKLEEDIIYLDHASVSPWPYRTTQQVKNFADENLHLGATSYSKWLEIETRLKAQLQRLINAPSINDIALLKNTSEALSVVADGLNWREADNIVSTNEEFPSNRIPWEAQAEKGVQYREIDISDIDNAEKALIHACDNNTRLITVSSVQYASGRRLDLEFIGNFCKKNNILFCVDAIQSLGVLPFNVEQIKADFVMADAHKWMLGPEGIALFYCSESLRKQLKLHQYGWHMVEKAGDYTIKKWVPAASSRRFECGSPNMLGIHALSASLSLIEEIGIEKISRKIIKITNYIIEYIKNNNNYLLITPDTEAHRAGIVNFKVKDHNNAKIHSKLLKNKVICANRMGGIRFSPHFYISENKIDACFEILSTII